MKLASREGNRGDCAVASRSEGGPNFSCFGSLYEHVRLHLSQRKTKGPSRKQDQWSMAMTDPIYRDLEQFLGDNAGL